MICSVYATASNEAEGRADFEREIAALHADVTALAAMVANDAHVRSLYRREIARAAHALRREALAGTSSWSQAARRASALRNDVLEQMRWRTSPVGRALAEQMKLKGRLWGDLLAHYTQKLFGKGVSFSSLGPAQQERVYAELVAAAGRSDPKVNLKLARWARVGRGLLVLSVGVSVYNVVTAEDPGRQAVEEVAVTGVSIAGGIAGGALAGLACGPGAPVCVTIGAVVGGALAAFGVGSLF
jgi:hypothetical protein